MPGLEPEDVAVPVAHLLSVHTTQNEKPRVRQHFLCAEPYKVPTTHREPPGTLCYAQAGTIRETPSKTLQTASTDPRLSQREAVGWSHLLVCQITLWRNGVLLCRVWG